MRNARKVKKKSELHPLSAAVKRIREVNGWSQERMARETNIATQTISRFELSKQIPRDIHVLTRLCAAAAEAGLTEEEALFTDAISDLPMELPRASYAPVAVETPTPQQWRLMQASRVANLYFPDVAKAMERAAGPALELVDAIIAGAATDRVLDGEFYGELELQLNNLAARKVFQDLKKEGGQ